MGGWHRWHHLFEPQQPQDLVEPRPRIVLQLMRLLLYLGRSETKVDLHTKAVAFQFCINQWVGRIVRFSVGLLLT